MQRGRNYANMDGFITQGVFNQTQRSLSNWEELIKQGREVSKTVVNLGDRS